MAIPLAPAPALTRTCDDDLRRRVESIMAARPVGAPIVCGAEGEAIVTEISAGSR